MTTWVANNRELDWTCIGPAPEAVAFHRTLEGYEPTPLIELPDLARELGVGRVLAKNEAGRLGLPAFKALGASWAIHRTLRDAPAGQPMVIVTATDGNHGRAVAKFSRILGHTAKIVIPPGVHPSAVQAIVDEGAEVFRSVGTYDDAVAEAARIAEQANHVLVQDTAWDGYEEVPGWIVEGYATMFTEIDDQVADLGLGTPDLVIVPTGVGSLLQGALQHYRSESELLATKVVSVEPTTAACVVKSIETGEPSSVPTETTVMAGLNCGTISSLAWPYVRDGLDAGVAVTDRQDIQAAHDLAALGVAAGPCGASGLAGLREALTGEGSTERRAHLGINEDSVVIMLITEGSDANPVPALD